MAGDAAVGGIDLPERQVVKILHDGLVQAANEAGRAEMIGVDKNVGGLLYSAKRVPLKYT